MTTFVPLGEIVSPAAVERAGSKNLTVLSMTSSKGLVPQSSIFKKRIASKDLANYKIVRPNQLVVGIHLDEGAVGFSGAEQVGIVSPAYAIWQLKNQNSVHVPYLERFIRSPRALTYFASKYRETAERRGKLTQDQFLSLSVPLPDVADQRRVAFILDKADALCAQRQNTLDQLERLLQSLFAEIFGDPVTGPKNCSPMTLADCVASLEYGPRFYDQDYSADGVRIVRITDLDQSGALDFEAMPRMNLDQRTIQRFALQPGDIVFARTGATVGKVALISAGDPPCIAGAYFIRLRFDDSVLPLYAASVLRAKSIQELIAKQSRQAAQQNFSGPGLRALPMPVPPMAVQQAYAKQVERVFAQRRRLKAAQTEMHLLFSSLQHRAFQGAL